MNPGQTQTLRFSKAGTFSFVCSYHQAEGMTGTLTVR
jgi:plastocyanin